MLENIEYTKNIKNILNENRQSIETLLTAQTHFNWDNLMQPLEALNDRLHQSWSYISHLHAVMHSEVLRDAYNQCIPELSAYHTALGHHEKLYQAILSLTEPKIWSTLNLAQKQTINHTIRDFKLAGVGLGPAEKEKFAALNATLSQLTTQFEENLLDATQAWSKYIHDASELSGIPTHACIQAEERAISEKANAPGETGWLFNLEMPSYLAIIMYADSRTLREETYRAYVTRAPENEAIIQDIVSIRFEIAQLLGFKNYAEQSLSTKMAASPDAVLDFLTQLAELGHKTAELEYTTLCDFAKRHLNLDSIAAWDMAYCSEKLRQHQYDLSQEALRPYFSVENVMNGLFDIVKRLFGVEVRRLENFSENSANIEIWHPDVRGYALYPTDQADKTGQIDTQPIGYCYFDLYARPNKRSGAWMDDCRGRRRLEDGTIQKPIALVTCNFSGPTHDAPALFTHEEVITLFHEWGHALQHLLTQVDYLNVSGINGIPWDAVELPSQFLENWAWNKTSLNLFARHYQSQEQIPNTLYKKMFAAKNFQSAMQLMRQIEFSLFDMRLHIEFDLHKKNQIQAILDSVRKTVSVVPTPDFNRFQHSFSHIFAGGYAAGYYSYKWAEVMASDAFSLFLEKGIFDTTTAAQFRTCILEPGGSEDPAVLYRRYRGRDPDIKALLRETGIIYQN